MTNTIMTGNTEAREGSMLKIWAHNSYLQPIPLGPTTNVTFLSSGAGSNRASSRKSPSLIR